MARVTKEDLEAQVKELTAKNEELTQRVLDAEQKLDNARLSLEDSPRYKKMQEDCKMYKTMYTNKQKIIDSVKEDNAKLRDKVQELLSTIEELQEKLSATADKNIGGRPERFTGAEKEQIAIEYTHSSL